MSIPKRGHTQETTYCSSIETDFLKGVTHVSFPKRGHTQETTYSNVVDFLKGVTNVCLPKRHQTYYNVSLFLLRYPFRRVARSVDFPQRGPGEERQTCSVSESLVQRDVSSVSMTEKGFTWPKTSKSLCDTDFSKGIRNVSSEKKWLFQDGTFVSLLGINSLSGDCYISIPKKKGQSCKGSNEFIYETVFRDRVTTESVTKGRRGKKSTNYFRLKTKLRNWTLNPNPFGHEHPLQHPSSEFHLPSLIGGGSSSSVTRETRLSERLHSWYLEFLKRTTRELTNETRTWKGLWFLPPRRPGEDMWRCTTLSRRDRARKSLKLDKRSSHRKVRLSLGFTDSMTSS